MRNLSNLVGLSFLFLSTTVFAAPLITGLGGPAGYGASGQCLSPNDDGSSAMIDLSSSFPGGLRFFDRTHTSLFVNTNGNITFSGRVSTYTPNPFPVADQPMIAPFWADVDIRFTGGSCMGSPGVTCTTCAPCHNPTENGVWWHFENGRAIFTWDRVGYYSCHNNLRMNFQLILSKPPVGTCVGPNDFDVEFRYDQCAWETGDASGGSNGFGGTPAQAGFDAGNNRDFVMIPGSRTAGISANLCSMSNVGDPGVWRFQIRQGVVQCPEAGQACETSNLGVCKSGHIQCNSGSAPTCVADVEASSEICDGLDNDCDGMIDDGENLCGGGNVCSRGFCLTACSEIGCEAGLACNNTSGLCEPVGCENITCPEGEVCVGGMCQGACVGVTCPHGTSCRNGSCVDLCRTQTCDECTVCQDGMCIPKCTMGSCAPSETCQPDGRCLLTSCVGITCTSEQFCQNGSCVDLCTGVVCPRGQLCASGRCAPPNVIDTPDAGSNNNDDAGNNGSDATVRPGGGRAATPGCCKINGKTDLNVSEWAMLVLFAFGLFATRRKKLT